MRAFLFFVPAPLTGALRSFPMELVMNQGDVIALFKQEAATLGRIEASQSDIILKLAQLIADVNRKLSPSDRERLLYIGAVMYQEASSQFEARKEMDSLMKTSVDPQGN
jgi:hypothetical protein